MTDWFTADLHIGHLTPARPRGFDTVEDHDTVLTGHLREMLLPGDRLFVVGDISSGIPDQEDHALAVLAGIRDATGARLHLVAGNHDAVHPMHARALSGHSRFLRTFDTVSSAMTLKIEGQRAVVSHFPYDGDHTSPDRHVQWRARDCGAPVVHGHTHSTDKVSYSLSGSLQLCVSLDAWGMRPARKDDLAALVRG
ncbi:metallophosphoesterase family protein [Corynebacterium kalidii]|uniref:Metallophosphoesterase family protein n=1 Tax=Corynebacterium kalidii TaxID=2931982 RepID=A0A9X1WI59_9CORY|nr:metallophosphoesterase family protein [Corynebacterium kalidii]MCJ7858668.1 metallophosphoesterase family protein [Corynebacterium kalidii]